MFKKILIIFIVSLVTCHSSLAQTSQTKPAAATSSPAVTAEQQQFFTAAQTEEKKRFDEWQVEARKSTDLSQTATVEQRVESLYRTSVAQARYQFASEHVRAVIFFLMASLRLPPEEFRANVTEQGALRFERIPPAAKSSPAP